MPILHLRNVPEPLYQRLRELAAEEKRSLNAQAVALLEQAVGAGRPDVRAILEQARAIRKLSRGRPRGPGSLTLLHAARRERER